MGGSSFPLKLEKTTQRTHTQLSEVRFHTPEIRRLLVDRLGGFEIVLNTPHPRKGHSHWGRLRLLAWISVCARSCGFSPPQRFVRLATKTFMYTVAIEPLREGQCNAGNAAPCSNVGRVLNVILVPARHHLALIPNSRRSWT